MNVAGPRLVVTMSYLPPRVVEFFTAHFRARPLSFLIDAFGALVIPYVLARCPYRSRGPNRPRGFRVFAPAAFNSLSFCGDIPHCPLSLDLK